MPINRDAAGLRIGPVRRRWDSKDCLLYALGVGAGATDPLRELEFTTDNSAGLDQRVLPTMATVIAGGVLPPIIGTIPAGMAVHGEQGVELFGEIPVEGEIDLVVEITGIYDKGSGALVVNTGTATRAGTDEVLFVTRRSTFIRGEGGWGGDRGPSGPANDPPARPPDAALEVPTRPDQALLYRLSGDRNRLHSDPVVATRSGFSRPILHGLCTFGATGRVLLHACCDGDPARFRAMEGRFSSPVLPGETLAVHVWNVGDGASIYRTLGHDGRVAIDAGRLRCIV